MLRSKCSLSAPCGYRQRITLFGLPARRKCVLAAGCASATASAHGSPPDPSGPVRRYAVIGGGFAGVATAWHLLSRASRASPVHLELFDLRGLGAGGSGAAAGLLHPFTPNGKHVHAVVRPRHQLISSACCPHAAGLAAATAACSEHDLRVVNPAHLLAAQLQQPDQVLVLHQLLWKGEEAIHDALELVAAAERAAADSCGGAASQGNVANAPKPFVWRQPLMRLFNDAQQARDFMPLELPGVGVAGRAVTAHQAQELLPGLAPAALRKAATQPSGRRDAGSDAGEAGEVVQSSEEGGVNMEALAALLVDGGLVVQPEWYLRALWSSCCAKAAGASSRAELVTGEVVRSLKALEQQRGPYDAVIVAAGAAVGTIREVGEDLSACIDLSQGYTIGLAPPPKQQDSGETAVSSPLQHSKAAHSTAEDSTRAAGPQKGEDIREYPHGAPSMLGSTYLAAQGGRHLLVGATRQRGFSAEQSLQECRRQVLNEDERQTAVSALLPRAAAVWVPATSWRVEAVRSGVRALPHKSQQGATPLAGRLSPPQATANSHKHRWWVLTGLGARGLVYHAWLGRLMAAAVTADDESLLPAELLRWKGGCKGFRAQQRGQ